MNSLLSALENQGFNEPASEIKAKKKKQKSTVNRTPEIKTPSITYTTDNLDTPLVSSNNFDIEDFENITGLPQRMMNLTVFQLVKKFGGELQLKGWADILSKLMTAMEKDQKYQERRNQLIEKDFVISNVFKYLDVFMDAVFDMAEAQTEVIISLVQSDPETARKEIPLLRKNAYTKISKEAKKGIKDSLKRLKDKYDIDE